MSRNQRDRGAMPPPASNRQNEYFVPRDGIDREVITADICRYLGNDALVRPGVYNDDSTGRSIQGYYITAYRNLTTAMITDLKADSARWDQERRKHQSAVQYQNSSTRESRYGGGSGYPGNSRSDYDVPRYPGNDAPGYSSGAQTASAQQYPAQQYPGNAYTASGYTTQGTTGYNPTADPRAVFGGSSAMQGYTMSATPTMAGPQAWTSGADFPTRPPQPQDPYGDTRMSDATVPQSRTTGYPAASTQQQGYGVNQGGQYASYQQAGAATQPYPPQPLDNFYGRSGAYPATTSASQAYSDPVKSTVGNVPYTPGPQEYDENPSTRPGTTPSSTQTQMPSSGSTQPSSRREKRDNYEREERSSSDKRHHHYGRR